MVLHWKFIRNDFPIKMYYTVLLLKCISNDFAVIVHILRSDF